VLWARIANPRQRGAVGTDCKSAPASGNTAGYVPNTGQYLYDANGNMTYDPSKKIMVSYNPLNLPRLVEFDNDDNITYTYTATGTKLRKTVTSWKTTTGGTTDYSGQFLYQDNELMAIFTPVGRIVPMQYNNETFWKHEYNLKDHLGNTRVVFAAHSHGQPEVMQQTSYYPFGMTLQQQNFGGALNQPNKLLYNGKELQDDELAGVSLDWYDYGARMYDAQIGRWHVPDMLAEEAPEWSPFRYGFNNPVIFTDPTGMFEDWYENENNKMVHNENIKSQEDLDLAGIKGTYKGEEGYGINEETGQAVHYLKDGGTREFTQTPPRWRGFVIRAAIYCLHVNNLEIA
jgi:RHS repeat-associated protein